MIGPLFIERLFLAALSIGIGAIIIVSLMIAVSWCLRWAWELFEDNFVEQASWLKIKFSWIHLPKRNKRKKRVVK